MELELSKELTEEIDRLLKEMILSNNFTLTKGNSDIRYKAFIFCSGLNLIRFKNNLLYILLGGFIGLITSISTTALTLKATPDNTIKYIEQLNKLTSEKTERDYKLQKHLNDMSTELSLLKNESYTLKIKNYEINKPKK